MTTIIVIVLLAIILFMYWNLGREKATSDPGDSARKLSIWLLIGLLSIIVLFNPKIRTRIQELQRKVKS
jgi:uncharacterized membrane protein